MRYIFVLVILTGLLSCQSNKSQEVGDLYQGGVVFYILQEGDTGYIAGETHGLVAAMSDYATTVGWGCRYTDLPNVPNVTEGVRGDDGLIKDAKGFGAEIGDGFNNTNNILKDCPTAPAALAARSLGADWFLPSINELNQMYINKTTLEAVDVFWPFRNFYWSSTEYAGSFAWVQYFPNGAQFSLGGKNRQNYVRAVRAF